MLLRTTFSAKKVYMFNGDHNSLWVMHATVGHPSQAFDKLICWESSVMSLNVDSLPKLSQAETKNRGFEAETTDSGV